MEIANNERYAGIAAALGLPVPRCRCTTLRAVLADPPYTAASAPWADPGIPEAAGFAGLCVTSITGISSSTAVRELTQTVGDTPAVPGPLRVTPRTMLVTAFTAGASGGSLAYGMSWLRSVLYDECAQTCTGSTLCMLDECPACDVSTGPAADTCWADHARTLHDVVCIDGPRVVSQTSIPAASPRAAGATIEFTLVAAVPHIYRNPEYLAAATTFTDPAPGAGCDVLWVPVGEGRQPCPPPALACPDPARILTDPLAVTLPTLPPPPPPPRGACVTRERSAWALMTAPVNLIPRWFDSVPVLTVKAGDADLRRLTVRFHANPQLRVITSPDQLDPCTALTEINLTYLPRDTELVLDGRAQRAYVQASGGRTEPAESVLYGADGGPWRWPLLTCGGAISVLALADAEHHSPNATVQVALAARQDIG